ncbi:hypothetical protein NKR23_g4071 [Pleurostoma richardsiae]|uniref:Uncharacterized protein n=1 Tax=Pleurostoma richardsiae TaxID=41990 RepID=A0AA38VVT9_9PEZI|nr:hypothetical protein NKR23_g4071 [Pleurostoma richardsiae]
MTEPTSHRRRGSHKEDNRGDDDDLSDSDRGGRPPRSPTPARRSTPRPCFACPFLKHDPVKYRSCHNKQLTKISYVKQHIKRSHRQPTHCPRCMTELADLEALGDHLREQTCTVVPARRFDGASQRQLGQLSRRSDQRKEEVAQWFDIYEILFPGEPRPKSAYLGSDLCDDLIDFMLGAGSASLTAVISEKIPGGNKEVVGAAVGEGLRRMFQDWQGNSSNSNNNNRLGLLLGGETETASPTQVTEGPHDEGE